MTYRLAHAPGTRAAEEFALEFPGPVQAGTLPAVAPFDVLGAGSSRWISVVTIAALVGLWALATTLAWVPPLFLPSPQAVWRAFVAAWQGNIQGGEPLVEHLKWSAIRVFGAFALAVVTAVPIGIAMGVSRVARGVFDPPVEFYRPLPPLAYLPLIVIWFGIDETAKILLIFWCLFAFITCGFEHSVANMTLLTVSLLAPFNAAVSVSGYVYNLAFVTLGNIVGAVIFLAIPYGLMSREE